MIQRRGFLLGFPSLVGLFGGSESSPVVYQHLRWTTLDGEKHTAQVSFRENQADAYQAKLDALRDRGVMMIESRGTVPSESAVKLEDLDPVLAVLDVPV